ncbi:hypothetical protein BDZ91DRAFT_305923 [Kalaharituber pfeilii]|nr:hypothetical protein BDZ91DRAFT_305923 [Kalaharituber pfeilii]
MTGFPVPPSAPLISSSETERPKPTHPHGRGKTLFSSQRNSRNHHKPEPLEHHSRHREPSGVAGPHTIKTYPSLACLGFGTPMVNSQDEHRILCPHGCLPQSPLKEKLRLSHIGATMSLRGGAHIQPSKDKTERTSKTPFQYTMIMPSLQNQPRGNQNPLYEYGFRLGELYPCRDMSSYWSLQDRQPLLMMQYD